MAKFYSLALLQARIAEEERQFESFMTQSMDADWATERSGLLDRVMTTGWERTGRSSHAAGPTLSPRQIASPFERLGGGFPLIGGAQQMFVHNDVQVPLDTTDSVTMYDAYRMPNRIETKQTL